MLLPLQLLKSDRGLYSIELRFGLFTARIFLGSVFGVYSGGWERGPFVRFLRNFVGIPLLLVRRWIFVAKSQPHFDLGLGAVLGDTLFAGSEHYIVIGALNLVTLKDGLHGFLATLSVQ